MEVISVCNVTIKKQREESFEHGLPEYLQHDLDAYKKALK